MTVLGGTRCFFREREQNAAPLDPAAQAEISEENMKRRMFGCVILSLFAALISVTASAPAAPDSDKEAAFRWLDANADAMRRVSLNIWNTPELALHEYKSSRELIGYLESNGFRAEKGVAGMPTAFIATHGGGKPVIAI
jgi:hypothetical protein